MTSFPHAGHSQPKGIGGWLIFPMLGTLFFSLLTVWATFQAASVLSTKLSSSLFVFVLCEVLINSALGLAWIVATIGLFKHKRFYPSLFVTLCAVGFLFVVGDLIAAGVFFNATPDFEDMKTLMRPLVALVFLGPYMFKSKRVRRTFVVD